MAANKSPLAFGDIDKLMDRALDAEKGLKVTCTNHAAAMSLRYKCHTRRAIARKESKTVYPEDHRMHGNSPWDNLSFTIPKEGDGNILHILRIDAMEYAAEEL